MIKSSLDPSAAGELGLCPASDEAIGTLRGTEGMLGQERWFQSYMLPNAAGRSKGESRRGPFTAIVKLLRGWRERDRYPDAPPMMRDPHIASLGIPPTTVLDVLDDVSRRCGHQQINGRRVPIPERQQLVDATRWS
jgi:hypothetical protein